jgi:hypothetical protein
VASYQWSVVSRKRIKEYQGGIAMKIWIGLSGILLAFAPVARASDTLVPLDTAGKITVIDQALEKKVSLFPGTTGFVEARMFRLEDGSFTLETTRESGKEILRDRISLSSTAADSFRTQVSERIARLSPQSALDQKGRNRLINGIRVLSAGFYGWGLPASLDIQNGGVAGGMYLVTAGTGFFLPLYLTRGIPVSEGAAEMALYGGYDGIAHAILLHLAIQGADNMHSQTVIATSMAASLGEMYQLFGWANRSGISGGRARAASVSSEFGAGIGLAAAYSSGTGSTRAFGLCGLAGSALGFWSGLSLASRQNYSPGDASLLQVTGLLGAYVPVSALQAAGISGSKTMTNAGIIGAFSGLALGNWMTADRDISEGQAFLAGLGTASGGLLGLGIAYLARPNDLNQRLYSAATAVGACAGLGVTWWITRDDAPSSVPAGRIGWRIRTLSPGSAVPMLVAEAPF